MDAIFIDAWFWIACVFVGIAAVCFLVAAYQVIMIPYDIREAHRALESARAAALKALQN